MPKWKYPDPKLKSPKEKWYENVPDDPELEKWITALVKRHTVGKGTDAAFTWLMMKLVHLKMREVATLWSLRQKS